jgi:hypothetical protein
MGRSIDAGREDRSPVAAESCVILPFPEAMVGCCYRRILPGDWPKPGKGRAIAVFFRAAKHAFG